MALTDTFVRQAKHSGNAAGDKHADGGGMYLHVTGAGKYWRMAYRYAGKQKTLALGVYPAVTLAKARKARDKARELLAQEVMHDANERATGMGLGQGAGMDAALLTTKLGGDAGVAALN